MASLLLLVLAGCTASEGKQEAPMTDTYDPASDSLRYAGEVHLRNIRQLTFGGNNAEAYWSPDDTQLIFQTDWAAVNPQGCDQQYVMNADGSPLPSGDQYRLVSTGQGRTTCGYFLRDGRVIFGSTHAAAPECPQPGERRDRYVWDIFPTFDIYVADPDGANIERLIGGEGYDAEPTVSPDGKYIIFTSTRSGDLELWRYELATGDLLQLTDGLGYDGGAFFSHDSQKIVWRTSRPEGADAEVYRGLLANNQVEPGALNIFVADIDGSNIQQVTDLPGANWAPFFHPSGNGIIFASNHHSLDQGGRVFDVFTIKLDGTGLEQITHTGTFDAFPMFSSDGTRIVFASNRNAAHEPTRDTNIFVADWIEEPTEADRAFQPPGL
jgi:Tol biopolymer transport system component